MFLFCLVFAIFCARLFICVLWSPAGKRLTSWLSFVVSSVSLSLSHWYPGSGVVLDCIDSWSLQPYYFESTAKWNRIKGSDKWCISNSPGQILFKGIPNLCGEVANLCEQENSLNGMQLIPPPHRMTVSLSGRTTESKVRPKNILSGHKIKAKPNDF